MSCTQAEACGYHQNGITTQSLKGEGKFKVTIVSKGIQFPLVLVFAQ